MEKYIYRYNCINIYPIYIHHPNRFTDIVSSCKNMKNLHSRRFLKEEPLYKKYSKILFEISRFLENLKYVYMNIQFIFQVFGKPAYFE